MPHAIGEGGGDSVAPFGPVHLCCLIRRYTHHYAISEAFIELLTLSSSVTPDQAKGKEAAMELHCLHTN